MKPNNLGFWFKNIWKVVSTWLDKDTKKKITIFSKNGYKELSKIMDPDLIPKYLGGQCESKLTDMPGTFSQAYRQAYQNGELLPRNVGDLDIFYSNVDSKHQKRFSKTHIDILPNEKGEFKEEKLFEYEKDLQIELKASKETQSQIDGSESVEGYNFDDDCGVHSGSKIRKLSCRILRVNQSKSSSPSFVF